MVSVNAHKRCCHMYESLSDEEIVQLARDTDDEALEHLNQQVQELCQS